MKVFVFLRQKNIKVQLSKFRKISMDFYFVAPDPKQSIWGKKSTSKTQKHSLYEKMFCLISAKVK